MYCGKCGKKIPDGHEYCMYCGAKVKNQIQEPIEDTKNLPTLEEHKTHFAKRKKIITISVVAVVFIVILVSYLLLLSPIAPLSEDESRTIEASEMIQKNLAGKNSFVILNAYVSNEKSKSLYKDCKYRVFLQYSVKDASGQSFTDKAVYVNMTDGTTFVGTENSDDKEAKDYYVLSEADVYGVGGVLKPSDDFNQLSNIQIKKVQARINSNKN